MAFNSSHQNGKIATSLHGSTRRRVCRLSGADSPRSSAGQLVAHCHLGLGKLYRRTGKQAREHLTAATTLYRALDLQDGLELAEAEMRQVQSSTLRS